METKDMAAKKISLSTLVPLPYNPRTIGKPEMERLKASIKRHTLAVPEKEREGGYRLIATVTVNRQGNRVVGGNQRVQALKDLGQDWIHDRDITWVDLEPDGAQEKEAAVSLNRDDSMGRWDTEKLSAVLDEIKVADQGAFDELDLGSIEGYDDGETPDGFEMRSKVTKGDEEADEASGEKPAKPAPSGPDQRVPNKFTGEPGTEVKRMEPAVPPLPQASSGPASDDMPVLFPVSYAVTADQRKAILEAINKARERFKVETSADALAKICEEFLKPSSTHA
jgi:hypothetical protein